MVELPLVMVVAKVEVLMALAEAAPTVYKAKVSTVVFGIERSGRQLTPLALPELASVAVEVAVAETSCEVESDGCLASVKKGMVTYCDDGGGDGHASSCKTRISVRCSMFDAERLSGTVSSCTYTNSSSRRTPRQRMQHQRHKPGRNSRGDRRRTRRWSTGRWH